MVKHRPYIIRKSTKTFWAKTKADFNYKKHNRIMDKNKYQELDSYCEFCMKNHNVSKCRILPTLSHLYIDCLAVINYIFERDSITDEYVKRNYIYSFLRNFM
jgi:hypothetical protein